MASRIVFSVLVYIVMALGSLYAPLASAADNIQQYRAAMTKIFLWKYRALPIFRLNPIFPGDVIQLNNETKYLTASECYATPQRGKYRGIQDYREGTSVAISGGLTVKGQALSAKIAEIEASGQLRFYRTASITISPLSIDEVDTAKLASINHVANCGVIVDLLRGRVAKYVIAQSVLHGRSNIALTATTAAGASIGVKGELAKISRVFGISEADIGVAGSEATFLVSATPDAMTLAIVPAHYSFEEVARITHYLQGRRGADLEIAVNEALIADNLGLLQKARLKIDEILGKDNLQNKERWAEILVNGEKPDGKLMSVAELGKMDRENVDFHNVGNYAAAMELERLEVPR